MSNPAIRLKHLLVGQPLPSDRLEHERLDKKTALAVLSSDAISSVAYATDQILFVVGGALGAAALGYVLPISAVIVALLALVGASYRQTIFAYPNGGGSYTVAKENLGVRAGLVAAAALLTDYILTVAVSIAGGVAAITSAYPTLLPHTVALCLGAIALLALMNLRGVRESGAAFSVPTYVFIAAMLLLIGTGLWRVATGHVPAAPPVPNGAPLSPITGVALGFLLLRGFAEGCAAMTGTEAISNGVMAFRAPASRNAATTLGWMVAILAVFFLGVGFLAHRLAVMPTGDQTVLSLLGRRVFGEGASYYLLQYSTFAVLVLAANTAFADFPRLGSILAQDRYLPRQLAARGDRLAFSNGILVLATVAALLVGLFGGRTNALVPLYALGVFLCFTLSQAGMVVHWRRTREPGWQRRAALNALGAAATAVVTVIQVVTKFAEGGWIIVVLVPLLIWLLVAIHRHYETFAREIAFTGQAPIMFLHHTAVVPVSAITRASAGALVYATSIADDVRAVYVEVDPVETARMRARWDAWDVGVELVVLPSPYRSVLRPLVDYVDELQRGGTTDLVTVVVPEVVPRRWWEHLLHNKTALFIRAAFLVRSNVIVTSVPYVLGRVERAASATPRSRVPDVAASVVLGLVVAVLSACRADGHRTDDRAARRLAGRWEATFDGVSPRAPTGVRAIVRGELAIVPAHRLAAIAHLDAPTDVGSFDVDFRPLGFDVADRDRAPSLVAQAWGSDSVRLVLLSSDREPPVTMRGAWSGDSIVGRWYVELARTAGAEGSFVLAPRR